MTVGELRAYLDAHPDFPPEMEILIEREDDASTLESWGTAFFHRTDTDKEEALIFTPAADCWALANPYEE